MPKKQNKMQTFEQDHNERQSQDHEYTGKKEYIYQGGYRNHLGLISCKIYIEAHKKRTLNGRFFT